MTERIWHGWALPANTDFVSGVRDCLPLAVSVVPFGMILAATAVSTGFSPLQAVVMSAIIFGGAAQAAMVDVAGQNTSIGVIVFTALVVNLRYVMYSGSLAPHLRKLSSARRSVIATMLIDQVYALAVTEFSRDTDTDKWWYYLGIGLPMVASWVGSHVVGAVVGSQIPESLQLQFVLPLVFVSLMFTAIEGRATRVAAAVAALVAIAGAGLPFNSGLIVAASAGVVAGLVTEGVA